MVHMQFMHAVTQMSFQRLSRTFFHLNVKRYYPEAFKSEHDIFDCSMLIEDQESVQCRTVNTYTFIYLTVQYWKSVQCI